jgi:hypothetical protein
MPVILSVMLYVSQEIGEGSSQGEMEMDWFVSRGRCCDVVINYEFEENMYIIWGGMDGFQLVFVP